MTRALWVALPDRGIMPLLAGDGDIAPLWSPTLRPRFPALRHLRPGWSQRACAPAWWPRSRASR